MSVHHPAEVLEQKARIVSAPALRRNRHQRMFDMHPGVHGMLAAAWIAFVAILTSAFMNPYMVIPAAICFICVCWLYLTPAIMGRARGDDGLPRQSWSEFKAEGIETYTGHLSVGEALAQIMVLPALLVGVAIAMAVIKLTV